MHQVEISQDLTTKNWEKKSDFSSSWAYIIEAFLCFEKESLVPLMLICWKIPLPFIIILNALCSMPVCQHEKLLKPAEFVEPTWIAIRTSFQAFV